jgi:hypothetical protein
VGDATFRPAKPIVRRDDGFFQTTDSEGNSFWTDRRYQNEGAQVTLRPGDPPLTSYVIEYDQWKRMVDEGILNKYDMCELLEGVIAGVAWHEDQWFYNSRHFLADLLYEMLPEERHVFQVPWFKLGNSSPNAECAVFRGSLNDFGKLHRFPVGSEISLVVEVAEPTTLETDRVIKGRIYAGAGIPEYWIVNLPEFCLEVYRDQRPATDDQTARYASLETYSPDQAIDVVLEGVKYGSIDLGEIFPDDATQRPSKRRSRSKK